MRKFCSYGEGHIDEKEESDTSGPHFKFTGQGMHVANTLNVDEENL
jgi:hypothetical protein